MADDKVELQLKHGELTSRIIRTAFKVHSALGPGFPESVYHNALCRALLKDELAFTSEKRYEVWYDEALCGEFRVDLLVQDKVIVEIKAVEALVDAHMAQCISYLKASGLDLVLLMNFGERSLKVKRVVF